MATFPSKVNYATGDILTATNMNEIGQAINLLDGAQGAAGKNTVINGGMDIWQRGTSFTGVSPYYTADRFQGYRSGAAAGATWSRQTSSLTGSQYCIRVQRNSGNTATNQIYLDTTLETLNSIPMAGKTVTFSFYARVGSNFSAASGNLAATIFSGTGTDQVLSNGLTGSTAVVTANVVPTTSWARFTISGTVATTATQLAVQLAYTPVGTASTNDYFEATLLQLEAANTASNFQRAAGNIQGELAACQRYYWRWPISTTNAQTGIAQSTTITDFYIRTPVTMRANGTAIDFTALQVYNIIGATNYSSGSFTLLQSTVDHLVLRYTHGSAVFTLGAAGYVLNGSGSTAYVGITGEL